MPPDLAALLVDAAAVSAADAERAVARQREHGGGLDTALLELALVDEPELIRSLARASGLPPAPEPLEVDPRAQRVLPARVAERHRLAPFALRGKQLLVVAAHPVDLQALDEISLMLGLHLVPHVAPEWRVRELMARLYGLPWPDRLAAVAGAVRASAPVEPAAAGPASPPAGVERSACQPAAAPAEAAASPGAPAGEGSAAAAPDQRSPLELGHVDPVDPLASAVARAVEAYDASALLAELAEPDPIPPEPPGWGREEALAELEVARDRDEVVCALLRHARDHLEAAAVLAVGRRAVTGVDAVGWPDARRRCRSLALDPARAGVVTAVLSTQGAYLGPAARDAGNEALLAALGRPWPAVAVVHPLVVRDRLVGVLYGDNGEAPVSPARVGDLLLVVGAAGRALERIVRDRKRRGAPGPAVPDEGGWGLQERGLLQVAATPRGGEAAEPFRVAPARDALAGLPAGEDPGAPARS